MKLKIKCIFLFILVILTITSYAQPPKGYYFKDIKNTKWVSQKNISDTTILNGSEIGLHFLQSQPDSLKYYIWAFTDSLTITYYNSSTNRQEVVLACEYFINEEAGIITFQLNNKPASDFNYSSISTGSYIVLHKKKK